LKKGRLPEAESAFRRALEQYPGSYRAQAGLRAVVDPGHKVSTAVGDF
jgi:hypothetical protein